MNILNWIKSLFKINKPMQPKPIKKTYEERELNSPNHTRGAMIVPKGVVFHHSCGTWLGDIEWIMNGSNPSKGIYASYHCLINHNGDRVVFGRDTDRMWHAGASKWMGKNSCNDFMLGCAFSGSTYPEEQFGALLNDDQINSAIEWLKPRFREWKFSLDFITDHRQVSPHRKNDLNPTEWTKLLTAIKAQLK
jgi:AmpD protein